ncbi:MAG: PIN domain-containing protein [Elusimicrobia bacterium]|nr:PIN domain-containing protein [Elusimicrobiota bacterium]
MIFVDSGAFIARWLEGDGKHAVAVEAWEELAARRERLFTSELVLNEVVTYLGRRAGGRFAAERGRSILGSRALTLLRLEPREHFAALSVCEKYADQGLGYADACSFVLMRRQGLKRAFTFDAHFALAGFTVWPPAD